jgi:hypothetical protein
MYGVPLRPSTSGCAAESEIPTKKESCNDGGRPVKQYEIEARCGSCACDALDSVGGVVLRDGRSLRAYELFSRDHDLYAPANAPLAYCGFSSVAILIASIIRPQLRTSKWFWAACHGILFAIGLQAIPLASYAAVGQVSCL